MRPDLKEKSDYELIQMCLAGDEDCFTEIVTRYKNLVYSIILRMTNNIDEADDLAQEVFVKIYTNLDKYYPEYKLSTWIIRITTNHVIDYRRKQKEATVPIHEVDYDLASVGTPESNYIQREKSDFVNEVLDSLPDMYKVPLILYHQQGLSYQEIADVIEEPLSKVKNRIFRGRRMLKDTIQNTEEGETYGLL